MFVDRQEELEFLNKEYFREGSSFVVIYGRRRIGKTALIKNFIKDKSALYFLATEESERENKKNIQRLIAEYTNNIFIKKGTEFVWEDLFTAFKDYKKEIKKILVIDEFQYLGKANSAFPSILQKIWDNILKDENIMIILCGSLISMMESQTLTYSSPLYGRRTGQIKMKQIDYVNYKKFFATKNNMNLIEYYAVTGGVPRYIELFRQAEDIYEAIKMNILDKQSFLFEEPNFLLQKEVGEIGTYFSIIKTIAAGNHKLGKIASALEMPQTSLTKYIKTLIDLDLLEREVPITEKNPQKSKKGLYYIKDYFIEFWFKFVYPYKNYLELGDTEYVMTKIKQNFIDNHVSFVYEKSCMEKMWQLNRQNKFNFKILKLGRWWNNKQEIDIVGFNESEKSIIYGECKYKKNKVDIDVFYNLVEKSKQVNWQKEKEEYYILFSKSGFTESLKMLKKQRNDLYLIYEV